MAKFKAYDYRQRVFLPVSLADQLLPGTLEFAIHTMVETRLDTSGFQEKYRNDETGRTAYDPKILLKIVLLGYARGLISSRKIEQACRENVVFIALACGQQPDHSTIATFVSSMKKETNASKEWSGTKSEMQRKKERLEAKVQQLLEEHVEGDKEDGPGPGGPDGTNREKQIKRLQKQAERIEKWLQGNEAKYGTTGKEISSNLTDNESAKMKTAHGVIQGYNSQALIDGKHQVIVHAETFGRGQDYAHGPPMLEGALKNLQGLGHGKEYFAGKVFTADTNYHSDINLRKCQELHLDAYIPDRFFRRRDPRYAAQRRYWPRRKRFTLEDFHYEEATNHYQCPQGKRLRRIAKTIYADGLVNRIYVAEEHDCQHCPLHLRCLTAHGGKRRYLRVPIAVELSNFSRRMAGKVDSDLGRKIYPQRFAVAEPVFANRQGRDPGDFQRGPELRRGPGAGGSGPPGGLHRQERQIRMAVRRLGFCFLHLTLFLRLAMKRWGLALLGAMLLFSTMALVAGAKSGSPKGGNQASPEPKAPQAIWTGQSGGFEIRWTTADVQAWPLKEPDRLAFSAAQLARRDFQTFISPPNLDGSEEHITYERKFTLLSVVGSIISFRDELYYYVQPSAHPGGQTRFTAIDLAKPGEAVYVSPPESDPFELDLAKLGKVALLTDYFSEKEVVRALQKNALMKEALAGDSLRSPAELRTLLEGPRIAGISYSIPPDLLTRFVFHHLQGTKVAVRLGLPSASGAARYAHAAQNLLLPIPPALKKPLTLAGSGKEGFLMENQKKLAGEAVTLISFSLDGMRK